MNPNMAPENDPLVQELRRLREVQESTMQATIINDFGWYGICAIAGRNLRKKGTRGWSFWVLFAILTILFLGIIL